jgi:hypothetical protein
MRKPSTDSSQFLAGLPTVRASVPGRQTVDPEALPKRRPFSKNTASVPAATTPLDPVSREEQRNYRYNRRQPNWLEQQRRERWILLLMIVAGGAVLAALIYLNLAK